MSTVSTTSTQSMIAGAPVVRWGPTSDRVVFAVHGLRGDKRDPVIVQLAGLAVRRGYQVVSVDLPGHGDRRDAEGLVPWVCAPQLLAVHDEIACGAGSVTLVANSLGAYFSLLALAERPVDQALLLAPLVDMVAYIERLLEAHAISEDRLRAESTIGLPDGQLLSWEYLEYARHHPVRWHQPTHVLWGRSDELVPAADIDRFAAASGAAVERIDAGHMLDGTVGGWFADRLR